MKTVVIKESFEAYPAGKLRAFVVGEEPELSDEFAAHVIAKGLARAKQPDKATKPEKEKSK